MSDHGREGALAEGDEEESQRPECSVHAGGCSLFHRSVVQHVRTITPSRKGTWDSDEFLDSTPKIRWTRSGR